MKVTKRIIGVDLSACHGSPSSQDVFKELLFLKDYYHIFHQREADYHFLLDCLGVLDSLNKTQHNKCFNFPDPKFVFEQKGKV